MMYGKKRKIMARVGIGDAKNLYEYWGNLLYRSVVDDSRIIINLASKEYSKCIEKYLTPQDRYITITFCELSGNKLVTKGTYAKMARGEMVRFMAENNIENPVEIQKFDRIGYSFRSDWSSDSEYVFEREIELWFRLRLKVPELGTFTIIIIIIFLDDRMKVIYNPY